MMTVDAINFLCDEQITEILGEEIDRLKEITGSKEQLEAGAMAKLNHCRGMLSFACFNFCLF